MRCARAERDANSDLAGSLTCGVGYHAESSDGGQEERYCREEGDEYGFEARLADALRDPLVHRFDVVHGLIGIERVDQGGYLPRDRGWFQSCADRERHRAGGVLRVRRVELRQSIMIERGRFHVTGDADDREPGRARPRRSEQDMLSDRVAARKESAREGLIDDG